MESDRTTPHHFPALSQMGPTRLLSRSKIIIFFHFSFFCFLFPIFVRHLCFAYVISHIFFLPSSPIYFSLNINIATPFLSNQYFLTSTTIEFQLKKVNLGKMADHFSINSNFFLTFINEPN